MKGACRGELLVAFGKNGNNQMYPIAWAMVDQETKHSWSWFLSYLIEDLQLGDGNDIRIMSDMQKVFILFFFLCNCKFSLLVSVSVCC